MAGQLLHSPADIIAWLLVRLGLASDPGDGTATVGAWPAYDSDEPDQPDNCITVYDTEAILDGKTHVDGVQQLHYGFQIRVRATTKVFAFRKAQTIAITLDPLSNVSIGINDPDTSSIRRHYKVYALTARGGVLYIGRESPNTSRRIYTLNYITTLSQTD